jgi:hypothetical protein
LQHRLIRRSMLTRKISDASSSRFCPEPSDQMSLDSLRVV